MKKWEIINKAKKQNAKAKTEEIIEILLANRGITTKKEKIEFLSPSFAQVTIEKLGIKRNELDKAIKRIKEAIEKKEKIIIYTDYDVDGLCAGAIVWETLFALGAKVMPYVPHRIEEGYGLSQKGIDFLKREYNPQLLITVDHGISAREEVDYARKLGIETIILDHHLLPKKLPQAEAIIHTTKLAAAGIAWIFTQQLSKSEKSKNLDLAALATIADLIPLVGPNRVIVKFGLAELNQTRRVGLSALIKEAGIKKGKIGVYEVGHILAPRINAMGRLAHALDALRLLCTQNETRAKMLAQVLSQMNRKRQIMMDNSFFYALNQIKHDQNIITDKKRHRDKLLFVSDESFHEGIIGLIAGKIAEEFSRPTIVVAKRKEYSKASARSINGFNIMAVLNQAVEFLENVGGHPMAAGFTVATKNLDALKNRLQKIAEEKLDEEKLTKIIKIDTVLAVEEITFDFYKKIQTLAPFGIGNPEPVFASYGVEILGGSLIGKEKKHLKLKIRDRTKVIEAIGFEMGKLFGKINPHTLVDIAYTIEENHWDGLSSLQLKLKDVKFPQYEKDSYLNGHSASG